MEQKICQCCAMPIDESTFGTEADGSKNQDYLPVLLQERAFHQRLYNGRNDRV